MKKIRKLVFVIVGVLMACFAKAADKDSTQFNGPEILCRNYTEKYDSATSKAIEDQIRQYISNLNTQLGERPVITIPVVVHVVYHNEAENISDERIYSQIDMMNHDFDNSRSYLASEVFRSLSADSRIRFCLARRKPNGDATNGITRHYTDSVVFRNPLLSSLGNLTWSPENYLNIWICHLAVPHRVSGYNIRGTANANGVVVDYSTFGYQRVATKSTGYWLGLKDIWGDDWVNDFNCTSTDDIDDTPQQTSPTWSNIGCPSFPSRPNVCGILRNPNGDMFMNYMDNTDDGCKCMFTRGQCDRMYYFLNTFHPTLATSLGCVPPTPSCGDPTNVRVSSIAETSAVLNWNQVSGAIGYYPQYRISGSAWISLPAIGGTNVTLSYLSSGSNYEFRVQTICTNNVTSNYSAVLNFRTNCVPITLAANPIQHPCTGNRNGVLGVVPNGGNPGASGYQYLWSNGETTNIIRNLPEGPYAVVVTDAQGCSATSYGWELRPTPGLTLNATPVQHPCAGNRNGVLGVDAQGGNPASTGYQYLWNTGATTSVISNLPDGSYTVIVTDAQGCSAVSTGWELRPVPGLTLEATPVQHPCTGNRNGILGVNAKGGNPTYTYLWNTGATTDVIRNLAEGQYVVTVTDTRGCSATSYGWELRPTAGLILTANPIQHPCIGSSNGSLGVDVTGGNPGQNDYQYLWSNGQTTKVIYNLPAGPYIVTVTDVQGCSASSYGWELFGRKCLKATYNKNSEGEYQNGIEEFNFTLYPIPVGSTLNIDFQKEEESNISAIILNTIGQVVLRETLGTRNQIDVSTLSNGLYFVKILEGETEIITQKITVYHQ